LLLATLFGAAKSKAHILKVTGAYITVVFLVYFAAGLGLAAFFTSIPLLLTLIIGMVVGAVIAVFGLIEIKDFFWYGQGFSLTIPPAMAARIHKYVQKITLPGVIFLGAFVAAVELPCTGAPYLAIIYILSQNFDIAAVALLALYNFLFISPLLVITAAVLAGTKVVAVQRWKQSGRKYMRLLTGLLLVFMAWLLIMIANGIINFG
jgi:cytochrome c biogenesis protein CcdA